MPNKRRWSVRQAGERRKARNGSGRRNLFSANRTGAFWLQVFPKGASVRREGKRSPESAGGLLVWLSVLIRRPGRVIRPPRALGPACLVAHAATCPGWHKQLHTALHRKAVCEFLEISKNGSLPGAPHPQEHKLWIWQLFHYFPVKIQKQNQWCYCSFVLFRVLQYLVAVSVVFLKHCTPSSALTLRSPECSKTLEKLKTGTSSFVFLNWWLCPSSTDNTARSRLYTNQVSPLRSFLNIPAGQKIDY